MKNPDLYTSAHLFVAAVRLFEYQNTSPPSVDEVCKTIPFSLEQGNLVCRKLHDMGIVEIVDGAYGPRLYIQEYLKIEEIPRDLKEKSIQEDLKEFKDSQKKFTKKIESMREEHKKKQENLFAELDAKLKENLKK